MTGLSRRLFLSLWPSADMQAALAAATASAVRSCGARAVPTRNLHVTLAFLGSVPEGRLGEIVAVADAVQGALGARTSDIELSFDHIEYWKKAGVLCATPGAPTQMAAALASDLKERLVASGFVPDLKPFRAHVTLARKVSHGTADTGMQSVAWRFNEYTLVESRTAPEGSSYSTVRSWRLYADTSKNTGKNA